MTRDAAMTRSFAGTRLLETARLFVTARTMAVVTAAILAAGCTFSGIRPGMPAAAPPAKVGALVLGEFTVADARWEPHLAGFRRAIGAWLARNGGFDTVVEDARGATDPVAEGVVLSGRITEMEEGSAALRFLVGMGAGQARIRGEFEIATPQGASLATFAARESYLGGAGIGGVSMLDMDGLMKRFAETVAAVAKKWAAGQPLDAEPSVAR